MLNLVISLLDGNHDTPLSEVKNHINKAKSEVTNAAIPFTNHGLYPARNFCAVPISVPDKIAKINNHSTCGDITLLSYQIKIKLYS